MKDISLSVINALILRRRRWMLIQSMGREMGVLVDQTPKEGHFELQQAGEGIEYSRQGCTKNSCRHVSFLKQKQEKDNFQTVIRMCLQEKRCSKQSKSDNCSRWARAYICSYNITWWNRQGKENCKPNKSALLVTDPINMEKLVKRRSKCTLAHSILTTAFARQHS